MILRYGVKYYILHIESETTDTMSIMFSHWGFSYNYSVKRYTFLSCKIVYSNYYIFLSYIGMKFFSYIGMNVCGSVYENGCVVDGTCATAAD